MTITNDKQLESAQAELTTIEYIIEQGYVDKKTYALRDTLRNAINKYLDKIIQENYTCQV